MGEIQHSSLANMSIIPILWTHAGRNITHLSSRELFENLLMGNVPKDF